MRYGLILEETGKAEIRLGRKGFRGAMEGRDGKAST